MWRQDAEDLTVKLLIYHQTLRGTSFVGGGRTLGWHVVPADDTSTIHGVEHDDMILPFEIRYKSRCLCKVRGQIYPALMSTHGCDRFGMLVRQRPYLQQNPHALTDGPAYCSGSSLLPSGVGGRGESLVSIRLWPAGRFVSPRSCHRTVQPVVSRWRPHTLDVPRRRMCSYAPHLLDRQLVAVCEVPKQRLPGWPILKHRRRAHWTNYWRVSQIVWRRYHGG